MNFLWNFTNKFNKFAFMNMCIVTYAICFELDYTSIKSFILKHYITECLKNMRHWEKKDINPRHYVDANTLTKIFKKEKKYSIFYLELKRYVTTFYYEFHPLHHHFFRQNFLSNLWGFMVAHQKYNIAFSLHIRVLQKHRSVICTMLIKVVALTS